MSNIRKQINKARKTVRQIPDSDIRARITWKRKNPSQCMWCYGAGFKGAWDGAHRYDRIRYQGRHGDVRLPWCIHCLGTGGLINFDNGEVIEQLISLEMRHRLEEELEETGKRIVREQILESVQEEVRNHHESYN